MALSSLDKIMINASLIAGFGVGMFFLLRKSGQKSDLDKKLEGLQPWVKPKVERFLSEAAKVGIPLKVVSAVRSCEEQNRLYAQGRTTPGYIVTNAKCGQSDHNVGVAVDVVPLVNGKPKWDVPESTWNRIGLLGEHAGLKWGGRWKSFKDRPHFYDRGGFSLRELWGMAH